MTLHYRGRCNCPKAWLTKHFHLRSRPHLAARGIFQRQTGGKVKAREGPKAMENRSADRFSGAKGPRSLGSKRQPCACQPATSRVATAFCGLLTPPTMEVNHIGVGFDWIIASCTCGMPSLRQAIPRTGRPGQIEGWPAVQGPCRMPSLGFLFWSFVGKAIVTWHSEPAAKLLKRVLERRRPQASGAYGKIFVATMLGSLRSKAQLSLFAHSQLADLQFCPSLEC